MKSILLLIAALLSMTNAFAAPVVCTMTFNSSDEASVAKKFYGPNATFVELVGDERNPNWFQSACDSKIACDVLIVSGHFGGVFFGEKKSDTLDFRDLERAGCDQTCPGILGAKSVYLFGCNTLAEKTPDHRSIDQYVSVLVNDGFPRELAETVASSRYAGYGLSIGERMALAFSNAGRISGFSSTSPVGSEIAPRFSRALRAAATPAALTAAFAGTSFRSFVPSSALTPDEHATACGLRSADDGRRSSALKTVLAGPNASHYFDSVLEIALDSDFGQVLASASKRSLASLATTATSIWQKSGMLIETKYRILKFRAAVGLITPSEMLKKTSDLIVGKLRAGTDYLSLDQTCSVAESETALKLDGTLYAGSKESNRAFLAHLAGCFTAVEPSVIATLKTWATSATPSVRREASRALEKFAPITRPAPVLPANYLACIASAGATGSHAQ